MAARDSRDKKGVERFIPPEEQQEKGKSAIFEGSGTKLGDIPIVPINLNKIDADHDLLKAFHSILYGAVGKKTVRKKNIRSFSGFDDDEDAAVRAARVKKLGVSKKWTVAALRDLCTLLGLEKGGDKSDVVDRIITFLASPDPAASKGPVAKKPKSAKKRKSDGGKEKKAKKVKREVKPRPVSGYIMFCKVARPKLTKDEGPMKPQEVMSKMAKLWSECTEPQKEKYKQAGVKEFEKKQAAIAAAGGGASDSDGEGDERKSGGKEKKAKKVKREVKPRPVSGYIMFCKVARPKLTEGAGPMKPQEVMSKMAQLWTECTDVQKEKYKQAGVKEFEKKQAVLAAAAAAEAEAADDGGDAEEDDDEE